MGSAKEWFYETSIWIALFAPVGKIFPLFVGADQWVEEGRRALAHFPRDSLAGGQECPPSLGKRSPKRHLKILATAWHRRTIALRIITATNTAILESDRRGQLEIAALNLMHSPSCFAGIILIEFYRIDGFGSYPNNTPCGHGRSDGFLPVEISDSFQTQLAPAAMAAV